MRTGDISKNQTGNAVLLIFVIVPLMFMGTFVFLKSFTDAWTDAHSEQPHQPRTHGFIPADNAATLIGRIYQSGQKIALPDTSLVPEYMDWVMALTYADQSDAGRTNLSSLMRTALSDIDSPGMDCDGNWGEQFFYAVHASDQIPPESWMFTQQGGAFMNRIATLCRGRSLLSSHARSFHDA